MDDEELYVQPPSNPNFQIKASKYSRPRISPLFTLADPGDWSSQHQAQGDTTAPRLPYVNHLVSLKGTSSIVAGFSSPSDSLMVFDVVRGGLVPRTALYYTRKDGITSLKADPEDSRNIIWSSGMDGRVQAIDLRVPENRPVCSLQGAFSRSRPFLSMDVSMSGTVAAGTEQNNEDASIVYWDKRNPDWPTGMHTSTHSEDINLLSFDPSNPRLLLSGAADGLLSITNVVEQDEDEAVLHVGNWGCSISKAGWMSTSTSTSTSPSSISGSLTPRIWSTSDMETMAIWTDELDLVQDYGDVRNTSAPSWKTDYIIGGEWMGPDSVNPWGAQGMTLWCGSNGGGLALLQQSRKDAIKWKVGRVLQGGHREIVRSVCIDTQGGLVVTGAEDGKIALWSAITSDETLTDNNDGDVEMTPSSPTGIRRKRSNPDDSDEKILKRKR